MRVAVIDIGTNSTRLLIVSVENTARLKVLHSALAVTRLGEKIEQAYLLSGAIDRTVSVIENYLEAISLWRTERIVAVATSAVRDAVNREEFLAVVRDRTGLKVRVLSGEEEASYSYRGVVNGLDLKPERIVVMDVGGGSTEFTWLRGGRMRCRSVDVGAVRVTESDFDDKQILFLLSSVLNEVREDLPSELIGVGGTVTTLAAMALSLRKYDPVLVHGYILTKGQVEDILSLLLATPLKERYMLPGLQPERSDIIVGGVRIVRQALLNLGLNELRVSETDIMYGLALEEKI